MNHEEATTNLGESILAAYPDLYHEKIIRDRNRELVKYHKTTRELRDRVKAERLTADGR